MKVLFFDFDGVILDSMSVREMGFREIFKAEDASLVERLISYHHVNGGLSRFHKIRYFYEEILEQSISEEQVQLLANEFSNLMKKHLLDPQRLIKPTIEFIRQQEAGMPMHIVSGSEANELRYLCSKLELDSLFLSIDGSPTPKPELVCQVIDGRGYIAEECALIGDSINDYQAAIANGVSFYGFNNSALKELDAPYIESFVKDFP